MRIALPALLLALAAQGCAAPPPPTFKPLPPVAQRPATEAELEAIKRVVGKDLYDPDSMLVRNVLVSLDGENKGETNSFYCAEYNGKNLYGAYVGYKPVRGLLHFARPDRPARAILYANPKVAKDIVRACRENGIELR